MHDEQVSLKICELNIHFIIIDIKEQIASGVAAKESIRRRKSSRRSIHGTLRAARGKGANEVADSFTRNDDYMDELDGEARTTETLRRMALPMHDKLSIK